MDKNYRELDEWINTLEGNVERLLEFKNKGELVKLCFNGHWLYSDTVTMDSAYLEVTGMSKSEFDKEKKKYEELSKIEEAVSALEETGYDALIIDSKGNNGTASAIKKLGRKGYKVLLIKDDNDSDSFNLFDAISKADTGDI